ncbi:unnamed protein product [Auanema sp. JU1783]|nr:unnamed protein product [Auanema sp. JU1783]
MPTHLSYSSGPVIAMRVRGDVRAALGSSKLWPLPVNNIVENDVNEPSIRQRLSLSDVRNVAHTSDAEFAAKELAIFEPFESPMTLLDQILSEQIVHKSTAQELHMSN